MYISLVKFRLVIKKIYKGNPFKFLSEVLRDWCAMKH